MSKRQFLEQMVENLIDNDIESARGNFHQFVVESAREIHASLIETDELEDDLGDEVIEEVFEADSEETTDFGAEIDAEGDEVEMGAMGDEEMGGEEEAPAEETVEVEVNNIDDIKAQLADLQAKFDELTGANMDEMPTEEVPAEEMPAEEFGAEETVDVEESEDFDLTEDDLLGLEEAFQEVKVTMDGGELDGTFAKSETSTETPVADKDEGHVKSTDLMSKQDAHKGFDKEKAPEAPLKSDSENVSKSGKDAWKDVHAKMDGGEQGDGKFATPDKSNTTPVAKN